MRPHLIQDVLIQFQFDLLDDSQRNEVAAHLEECGQCRETLERLKQRFSALDVLDNEEVLSDQLVQKTIASIHQSKDLGLTRRRMWFKWGAIAAGIVLAAAIVFMEQDDWKEQTQQVQNTVETHDVKTLINPVLSKKGSAKPDTFVAVTQPDQVRIVPQDQIPEKPPFAPASAIELVVLPSPDKMQVTIYNSADLTLVRDTRKLTLKAGWNWLQFMWAETRIDPTSLSLRPLEYTDKIDVQQLVYPARLKDIGRWLIRSEVEGAVPFEITYFTSGLTWKAFYEGTISPDEKTMQLKSYVRVQNDSGQDYQNTQTRLIVGKVHLLDEISRLAGRQYPYGPEIEDGKLNWKVPLSGDVREKDKYFFNYYDGVTGLGGMGGGMGGYDIKEIAKEGLSEYFLYTIEGTEDLPNQWAKRLPSLEASDIPIKSLYKYDEDRYASQTIRFVSFTNDTEHKLGTTPLPDGNIKLYRQLNDQQNLSYVGGAGVKYIPVNEEVELNLSTDPLVKVEPFMIDSRTDNYMFNDKGDITGWDEIETWKIKLTNTRDIPADFEVTRNFKTDSWDLKLADAHAVEYKKHDAQHARFTTTLAGQTQKEFSYSVTKRQGVRKEQEIVEKEKPVVDEIQDISLEDQLPWNSKDKPVAVYTITQQDKALETQLEKKVNLDLAKDMEFAECIDMISRSVEQRLPIIVMKQDLAENSWIQLHSELKLDPAEYSDITLSSALTKILKSAGNPQAESAHYVIRDGVIWIASASYMTAFSSRPSQDVTALMNLKANEQLNARLKKQITLNPFQDDLTCSQAIEELRISVQPPLPIAVMTDDLAENVSIQSDSTLDGPLVAPVSVPFEAALEIVLRAMSSSRMGELCYLADEDVIVIASRNDTLFGHYYKDPVRETELYSTLTPQVRAALNKKIDLSQLTSQSTLKDAFAFISKAAGPSLKVDVKWQDLSDETFIEGDKPLTIGGLETIKSISLIQAIRLFLYDAISTSSSTINCKIENDTLTIASSEFFEGGFGDANDLNEEQ